jgi:peroxiredoxin Q/BCP
MQATNFSLQDQNGTIHTLDQYKGKWVVLYFYPKDDTPGCTKEACNFRDNFHILENIGVQILGVSKDTVQSHKRFADKFNLNFPLLSDPTAETIKAYKAWGKKKFMGREFEGILRNTYLIDKEGNISKVYEGVNPTIHAEELIKDIKNLSA